MFSPEGQKKVNHLLSRYPVKANALLPVLHLAQKENKGYLTPEWLEHAAKLCEVPLAHVEGVATFYTMFKFRPLGKYHLQVCTNVSCTLCGGSEILEHLEERLNVHAGHTTEDGQFSLEEVECLGACGYGPVVIVNEDYHEHLTIEEMDAMIDKLAKSTEEWPERILPITGASSS
ncbi:MAG: NADH-quinone oxidoreductase subunit NuoE [SAR324 cluster bacterium]|nr:NADH-quinone oxidoreductase subunit NuoE [SAR324 cluster bacterium]